jgi:hypothetical protein
VLHWLRRWFGWDCCGEWTQWETLQAEYSRPPRDSLEWISLGTTATQVRYTRRWQERRCTLCGRVQQQELQF